MILLTAGLVVTKNNQLLLAYSNNKNAWYLPGGKVDKGGETPKEALIREIREELNIDLQPDKIESYKHISAPAYGESPELIMEQDTFRYDLTEKIQPSHEIAAVKFFDLEMYKQEPAQVPGVLKVFALLKEDDIIL